MNSSTRLAIPSRFWTYFFLTAVLICSIALVGFLPAAQPATGDSMSATYSRGSVHVTIPYRGPQSGTGRLKVEVLDPEDAVLGSAEHHHLDAASGKGWWQSDVKLSKALAPEDLVWHRIRYRFEYDDRMAAAIAGTESISEILRTPVVRILGQQSYLAGGNAAVRVIATDTKSEPITGSSSLRIELLAPEQRPRTLFTGRLNQHGTAEAQFRFPAGMVGRYALRYAVETPIGSAEFTQQVRIEDKAALLLTTEKPIYQPGQTIHVRALALDRANHQASADHKLTFELEDSRGNKVFKRITQTDQFGVASAEFGLADEVNLGTYHLRALMEGSDSTTRNTAEIAIHVERYVLPKFKVAIEFGGKDARTKRGYRPGDTVTGTIRANYFFGKPVDGAEVALKATGMDVERFEAGSVHGRTDGDGAYRFEFRLPTYFAGRPLSQGAARVLVEATVKDTAGHAETRGEPITVTESPLLITAVPEGGTLVPNLENQVFVLTSYPDGKPAATDLKVRAGGVEQSAKSDAGGVAVIRLKAGEGAQRLEIEAKDAEGNRAKTPVELNARSGNDQILLRTEKAVYHAGDRIQLRVFSTKERGTAYVDVVRDGQTVLTRDLDLVNGQAELSLTATADMAGAVDLSAYLFGRDARPVGDHRLVFVQPADELKIEATSDSRAYKPGDEARIQFRVTNTKGEGVHAALGLQVVDEAVFALAEKQPGFAKVFFYLEQEAMQSRYEIHSIRMPEVVEAVDAPRAAQRDRAARALFSATELVSTNKFETEFGRSVPQMKHWDYAHRHQAQFEKQLGKLAEALTRGYPLTGGDLPKAVTKLAVAGDPNARDAWGSLLRIERTNWRPGSGYYAVRSAGPDKRLDTADDLGAFLEVKGRKQEGRPSAGNSSIELTMERDRGAFNGRAEVSGTVVDRWGGALEGATVTIRRVTTGGGRTAIANADGRFALSGVEAGEYDVTAAAGGEKVSRKLTLEARDRAALTVVLKQDGEGTVVAVSPPPALPMRVRVGGNVRMFDAARGVAGGAAGGVIGGIIGGVPNAAPPPPPALAMRAEALSVGTGTLLKAKEEPAASRVRSYFPEALYINPEIVTDRDGRASISIRMADSITTWRMVMMASTINGALGSGTSSLKVFQDFFVDLDLPVTLTQGDRVTIPVAAYNYSGSRGEVSLQLKKDDWFQLVDDSPDKAIAVESDRVGGAQFTLEAKRIGKFKLTLAAKMAGGSNRADIVIREIEVVPDGREQNLVFNGRLESSVRHNVQFPPVSIADASKIFVRLYPGPLSQVIEGMDSILRMPNGCFEQTSSATYPNVLALDYMKRTKKLTPEVHAKAEGFIANGYQRLLTYEVPGGGFSWFGNAPANKILTSYGLMEFSDMSKVYDVDVRLVQRTQQWLAAQQQSDGGWRPDTAFINEGATNRYNSGLLRITAYIAWSLGNTGYQGPAVEKAKQYVEGHLNGKIDTYTLAVLANFAVDYGKDRAFTRHIMQLLLDARTEKDEQAWWDAQETAVYATGTSAAVETTGLAAQALLKWGEDAGTTRKAINYIAGKKDAAGTWGTTQATIMALRSLLLATEKGSANVRGTVELLLNGRRTERLPLTADNNDLFHQFVLKELDASGSNTVELRFSGKGGLAYQVMGRYFIPWSAKPEREMLTIDVGYDRTRLAQDDVATATATIRNNLPKVANMVMVDLGIPPGFDLLSEDLQDMQAKTAGRKGGRLEKFSQTATQAILYFDSIPAGGTVTVKFRLRAKYPIKAKTFQSRVYEYYDPEVSSVARPAQFEVRKK